MTRRWKIILALSLGFNLLVLGVVVGGAVHHRLRDKGDVDMRAFERASATPIGHFIRRLPDDHRAKVKQQLATHKATIEAHLGRLRDARRRAITLAATPEFDAIALQAQMRIIEAETSALQAIAHQIMVQALTDLPTDERLYLAERASRFLRHMPGRM